MQTFTTEQKIDMIFSWLLNTGQALLGMQPQALKAALQDNYIDEEVAATMLNYKPRTLRDKCKRNQLPINWRINPSGRGFQYNYKDIIEFKNSTSTEV